MNIFYLFLALDIRYYINGILTLIMFSHSCISASNFCMLNLYSLLAKPSHYFKSFLCKLP